MNYTKKQNSHVSHEAAAPSTREDFSRTKSRVTALCPEVKRLIKSSLSP